MKFAIFENNRIEASKGAKGICPSCGSELIPRCGEFKIHHWAHKNIRNCDPWWENETEWHRLWKNNFPNAWQETIMHDELTGEKHIADVRTIHGLVIEFQHSHIDPKERTSRERFYKSIVWVVDGTRLKRDYSRFLKGKNDFQKTDKKRIFKIDFLNEVFSVDWLNSYVPVVFDFKGIESISDKDDVRNILYCLFPLKLGRYSILAELPRKAFIKSLIDGDWSIRVKSLIENLIQ
ncbi:MAG: competence protein CoiA [Lentimicrobium sp.]